MREDQEKGRKLKDDKMVERSSGEGDKRGQEKLREEKRLRE